jgi:YspA, cpYpsA-related SLOG family
VIDALIIAGSRDLFPTVAELDALITTLPDLLICGCAPGVDRAGYAWARSHNIPVEYFPGWASQRDWALAERMDKEVVHALPRISNIGAGNVRNGEMARVATRGVLIWDGLSRGTRNMRDICIRKGIPCEVHIRS